MLIFIIKGTKMNKEQHIKAKADKEDKAMEWLNDKTDTTYVREEYEFSAYDGILTSGNTNYIIEIKIRENYSHEQIQSFGGSYLEFTKLNRIINYKNDNDDYRQILYGVFLKDRVNIYGLQPDPNYYTWELRWLPRNDFDDTKEWKMVTRLKLTDIIQTIEYKNKKTKKL